MTGVYATCPPRDGHTPASYRERLIEVARWAEEVGFHGILTHTDNTTLDPWAAAQLIIEHTETLVPMVAVNPIYMHPLSAVRMINTIGFLYGRRVDLNMVSGGFAGHLREAGGTLDHDQRFARLAEYGEVMRLLLAADRPVSHSGEFYALKAANLNPRLPPELMPEFFVAGASQACLQTQRTIGATRLTYPHEIATYGTPSPLDGNGVGFGVIARETAEEAWSVAHRRFPPDELGEELHEYSAENTESHWHQKLSRDAALPPAQQSPYWLYPFKSYRTFSPYLVGTYADVGQALSEYFAIGVTTVILDSDGQTERDDLRHAAIAFDLAEKAMAAAPLSDYAGSSKPIETSQS